MMNSAVELHNHALALHNHTFPSKPPKPQFCGMAACFSTPGVGVISIDVGPAEQGKRAD
ncbi:hypothetical protein [Paenibacillus sp. y28]|uniref:hypothetical protein n=1 Tax=Paenibacillus sp. y28 TaxID=3129110 RepID=UPI003019BE79